jgi:hypothetical protein
MPKFPPPISAYVLESKWESLDGIEMPVFVFVRLMYTTGYCKFYWQQKEKCVTANGVSVREARHTQQASELQ